MTLEGKEGLRSTAGAQQHREDNEASPGRSPNRCPHEESAHEAPRQPALVLCAHCCSQGPAKHLVVSFSSSRRPFSPQASSVSPVRLLPSSCVRNLVIASLNNTATTTKESFNQAKSEH